MSGATKIVDSRRAPDGVKASWWRWLLSWCHYETMSGNGQCPVYLERWTLLELLGCALYLHHFLGDDWAADPHDHPRRFISLGLKGWYWEDVFRPPGFECPHPECEGGWLSKPPVPVPGGWAHQLEDDGPCPICSPQTKRFSAPWIRCFPAEHVHRVRASECGNVWTLVLVLPKSRSWGFVRDGVWIPFKGYVFGGQSRKAC